MDAPLRLLLVGANQRWTRVVSAAATRLGASVLDTACNSCEALVRIVAAAQPYSMVLLQPRSADPSLHHLADLTAGDAGSGTGLLLLRDQRLQADLLAADRHPPGCIVVQEANRAGIHRAINQQTEQPSVSPWQVSPAELQEALTGPMLKLRYQPVVRLSDRTPIGLEVLARMDHPKFGVLAADHFIPQMEAANLAPLLTEVMITQAMRDACTHGLTELGLRIGMNVPLDVLMMPEIFSLLETQRQKCSIPAERLIIELTETQPVTDLAALRGVVGQLRDKGYRVSIDDASPEIANIEAMIGLGFTTLKFDKSVVQAASHDSASRGFIERIVRLTQQAQIRTIAEGIEDAGTQDLMRELGVDSGQGYLIGRPLPPATVKLWLDAWQQ